MFAFLVVRPAGEMADASAYLGFVRVLLAGVHRRESRVLPGTYFLNWACSGMADVTAAVVYAKFFFPDIEQWIPALIALAAVLTAGPATATSPTPWRGRRIRGHRLTQPTRAWPTRSRT